MKKLSFLPSFQFGILSLCCVAINLLPLQKAVAGTLKFSFTPLEGEINKHPLTQLGTGIYRASLPIDYYIKSISIIDIIGRKGGSPGRFSGFDLDAIKISDQLITKAEDIKTLPGLNLFDFSPQGTTFLAGTKRDPGNSKNFRGDNLFGSRNCIVDSEDKSKVTNCVLDNSVATLDNFDAKAITDQTAYGFLSLGDGGKITLELPETFSTYKKQLYIYVGEVGRNGEESTGEVIVIGEKIKVPEPSYLGALSLIGLYLTTHIQKKRKSYRTGNR
jgi:hypothetical protein